MCCAVTPESNRLSSCAQTELCVSHSHPHPSKSTSCVLMRTGTRQRSCMRIVKHTQSLESIDMFVECPDKAAWQHPAARIHDQPRLTSERGAVGELRRNMPPESLGAVKIVGVWWMGAVCHRWEHLGRPPYVRKRAGAVTSGDDAKIMFARRHGAGGMRSGHCRC